MQGLFQQFIACHNCTQLNALFQNIFKFYTSLPKFSNILPFFALFPKNRTHALTFQNRPWYVRGNEAPFMTKELHKAIMKRSRLRNKFLKKKNRLLIGKIITFKGTIVKNLRSIKKSCFDDFDISKINDNSSFRETIVRLFSNTQ